MKVEDEQERDDVLVGQLAGEKEGRQSLEVAEAAREKTMRGKSFIGQLFMGKLDYSLIYPFPEQSAEDRREGDALIEKVDHLLNTYLDPDEVDRTGQIPQDLIDKMKELGLFAMKIPKDYDGLGLSQVNYNRVMMRVASRCGATTTLLSAHQSIGVPQPLLLFGTEEQKKKWLPKFRQGAISAFALTENHVGSDPSGLAAEAKLSEDGTHYVLNGTKLWCTNGVVADVIVVMANTAPKIVRGKEKKQMSAFILDMKSPGVEVTHRCDFMGLKGIQNAVIEFKDVKVPAENIIWEEGRGLAMALATLNYGRLTVPAGATGAAKRCLEICRKWGNERVQWGKPIGYHEAGMEKIGYIAATTFAMEAVTWLTSHFADGGKLDIRMEAALAKYFSSESLWKIVDMTLQLRGGRGYETARSLKARGEEGVPIERIMRDCRINTIFEGSSEIMRLFLSREALEPHLSRALPLLNPKSGFFTKLITGFKVLGFYAFWYPKQWIGTWFSPSFSELGPLAHEMRFVKKTAHKLARSFFYYMVRYQQGLINKQTLLGRLTDIGTDLFAMAATISYAQSLYRKNNDQSVIDLARYFCHMAKRRIGKRFEGLSSNDDRENDAIATQVLKDELRWLEEGIIQDQ